MPPHFTPTVELDGTIEPGPAEQTTSDPRATLRGVRRPERVSTRSLGHPPASMGSDDLPTEAVERMRAASDRDVAVLPPDDVAAIIAAGGFDAPIQFLQTGLIRAWYARRA